MTHHLLLRSCLAIFCLLSSFTSPLFAADQNASQARANSAFFERNIRPILVKHCYECHSKDAKKLKANLRLDHQAGWLEGGDTGKAIIPGNPSESLLLTAVRRTDSDLQMPPKKALPPQAIRLLGQWIKRGAPGPKIAPLTNTLTKQPTIADRAKSHWAFQPISNPTPPATPPANANATAAWNPNPIDRFVDAKLQSQKLSHSPPAAPRTLIRRLSYDLTGLPPSPAAVAAFTQNSSPDKTADLINTLISSSNFGEHFARVWLDVARYADTANSYRPDTKTPHYYPYAFTYRDYVIQAFNNNLPIDQFIREQLAADLMDFPDNAPQLAALGFIGVSPHRSMSAEFIDDVIDTTTRGLLGLTAACARCHDHKFEPVPTEDYYSLSGVFASVKRPDPRLLDQYPIIQGYNPSAKLKADYQKQRDKIDANIAEVGNKTKGGNKLSLAKTIQETDLALLLTTHDGAPTRAMTVSEAKKPINPFVFLRGEPTSKGPSVPRRFLNILDPKQQPFNDNNSGRLDLANKIVDPNNPLTARVFVNRVWGALLGSYIVDTPSNFGLEGAAPSHPKLLDWLAADFIAHDWSLKHLVKQIVTSQTYQQRSTNTPQLQQRDPQNIHLARANTKRLSFEALRDSILTVSGQLDPRMRGRSSELWGTNYSRRRSIYGFLNRFNLDPTLRSFDFPSPVQTQGKRTESIVPPQALFTMNSPFVIDQAQQLITHLNLAPNTPSPKRVNAIFNATLQRPPHKSEQQGITRFVDLQTKNSVDPWPLVAQAIIMSNEFLYID